MVSDTAWQCEPGPNPDFCQAMPAIRRACVGLKSLATRVMNRCLKKSLCPMLIDNCSQQVEN